MAQCARFAGEFLGAYDLAATVNNDEACYPYIASWASTHDPVADVQPSLDCYFKDVSWACGSEDPQQGCRGSGKTCNRAFVHLVETHKAEFQIDGDPEDIEVGDNTWAFLNLLWIGLADHSPNLGTAG
ncbi:hypothetical protein PG994_008571 [Apiospora phragmitis]|uniref:Uncharacterized protein n=1 Tax=Apiospora phragmitis TaxID=2905665 RepID=A0ABR1UGU5_9PEZI